MKVATVSLDFYSQNSVNACKKVGQQTEAKNVDLAAYTEVRTDHMDQGLAAGLAPTMTYVNGRESPQAYKGAALRLLRTYDRMLTDGEPGITPNLFAVVGLYEVIAQPRKRIAFISTHLVPLTLNGKPRTQYAKRAQMWREHWRGLKAIVQELKGQGFTVIVAGDFNHAKAGRGKIKEIDPKAKWIIRKGLDWVFVIEGSTKVLRLGPTTSFNSGSDHRAWARIVIFR